MSRATRPRSATRRRLGVRGARLAQLRDQLLGLRTALEQPTQQAGHQEPWDHRERGADDPACGVVRRQADHEALAGDGHDAHDQRRDQLEPHRRDDNDVEQRAEDGAHGLQGRQRPGSGGDEHQARHPAPRRDVGARHAQQDPRDERDDCERDQRPVAVQAGPRVGEQPTRARSPSSPPSRRGSVAARRGYTDAVPREKR